MRRLLSVVLSFVAAVSLLDAAPVVKTLGWSLDNIEVEGRGDSLAVAFTWTVKDWNVPVSKAMVFCPSLRKGDRFVSLTPLSVYGRKVAQQADRYVASGDPMEVPVVSVPHPITLRVEDVVPLVDWMDTVKVVLTVNEWAPREGLHVRSTSQRGVYVRPAKPEDFEFTWSLLEPRESNDAFFTVSFSCPVSFEDGSAKFDIYHGDNMKHMDEFVDLVKAVSSSRQFVVRESSLVLTVPPTGFLKESVKLSRSRVMSVYSYMQKEGAFRQSVPARIGGGEDWQGVSEWVSNSRYRGDTRLVDVLSWEGRDDAKAGVIRDEKPVVWNILKEECFPFTGRVTYNVTYRPLKFSRPQMVEPVYEDVPQALSPHDFWFLAKVYPKGSGEWIEIIRRGADLFPSDVELNLDAAFALMDIDRLDEAAPYLRNADLYGPGRADYALAAWLYKSGRYAECIGYLESVEGSSPEVDAVCRKAVPFIRWQTNHVPWIRYYP